MLVKPGLPSPRSQLITVLLFGFFSAAYLWGTVDRDPLFKEQLIMGLTPLDTLFHSALSRMLQVHGVSSTGLDGLPYLSYHFGSHWLFAGWANLLGITTLEFYECGFPIVFAPLF